mmetsp:Transcript_9783/g.12325  ORF Transcript_9783/g.12325 Transcript_9783/m.12325 type:complete len:466 (+) Transcript_9783:125-1522(+)
MTGVTSDAAVASIKAPLSLLKSDSLLNLIINLVPIHQIDVNATKKVTSLSLTNTSTTYELTQRNAILRNICGMTFHNALDKYPHYLLGGHSASGKASSESALCLASISSYMSIASSIRSKDVELSLIYQQLNQVLATNSYLVGSTPKATLADLDVFFALAEVSNYKIDDIDALGNLKRWLLAVSKNIEEMIASYSPRISFPEIQLPALEFTINEAAPVFYFGDEEGIDGILTASSKVSPAIKGGNGNDKKATLASTSGGGLTDEQKKAAAEKRTKKNAEKKKKKAPADAAPKKQAPSADIDASAFDIRVGKIVEVWEHEESEHLWCEKVDLGEGEPRQILSGLRNFYTKEEMQDRTVLVLCNLKSRKLGGVPSHGMVLCASNAAHTEVEFVVPPENAKIGERVTFDGYDGDPEAENKFAKKKMLEKLAPDLKTDENGVVVWKNAKSVTSAGPCIASKGMKGAQVS